MSEIALISLIVFLVVVGQFRDWQHRKDHREGSAGLSKVYAELSEREWKHFQYENERLREMVEQRDAKLYGIKTKTRPVLTSSPANFNDLPASRNGSHKVSRQHEFASHTGVS